MTIAFGTVASRSASRQASRLLIVPIAIAVMIGGCRRSDDPLTEWQRVKSGSVDVVLLSSHGAVRHGRDAMVIEFRSSDGKLVDVGRPQASATMPMAGMPMFGSINLKRTGAPGRYTADVELEMAGTWRFNVQWQDASGSSSVGFSSAVQ